MSDLPFHKVGVLLGGESREREISLRSGEAIWRALLKAGVPAERVVMNGTPEETLRQSGIDFAFIALHGRGGEDGSVQRVLESLGIPYTGSGPEASWASFHKGVSKRKFLAHGIPTPPYCLATRAAWEVSAAAGEAVRLGFPLFVKPVDDGSSFGVYRVADERELERALRDLFDREGREEILIEKAILGREFTVGILEDRPLAVIELKPKRPFYDFEAKYTPGLTDYLVPAPLSGETARAVQDLALRVHHVLGLEDFSRVDLMTDGEEQPYVLEANSIPGFTATSLLPKAATEAGVSFEALCLKILELGAGHRVA